MSEAFFPGTRVRLAAAVAGAALFALAVWIAKHLDVTWSWQ